MKNRKQKIGTPKRPNVLAKDMHLNELSTTNVRCPSGHTKISTNSINHSHEKRNKNKKNSKPVPKQYSFDPQLAQGISRSGRKSKKYALTLKMEESIVGQGQQSYREYCLVDQNFIPITDNKHRQLMQEMFVKTASTTSDIKPFGTISKHAKSKLRKRTMSDQIGDETSMMKKVSKYDKAISNIQMPAQTMASGVEAVVESCEIGLQYSERKQVVVEEREKEKGEDKPKTQQTGEKVDVNSRNPQSLSDLFFKLQFTHLSDEHSFSYLNSNQKEHFSQLLETVITKLKIKEINNCTSKLKPIVFQSSCSESRHPSPEEVSPKTELNYDKLESLILLREYIQMNCIEDPMEYSDNSRVNTSLLSILNFLGHLFCHIEVHYAEEFVYLIRKLYGLTFREKYKRITRNLPMTVENKFKIIQESVFEDFVNDNDGNSGNYNEIVHYKAIFDAFNQHLEEYRPYYLGNGEQFPWAFKMFTTMSQYSIDQESLQIIFRQSKDKLIQWATSLCGLHIDYPEPLGEGNPLEAKRSEKETRMICSWIADENFQKDGIELFSTQTLHEAAERIYQQLLLQFAVDGGFVFN